MSEDSDASCNYNEIITSFINSKKQWRQVPEIVLLVIKAIYSHSQEIQQNLYAQRQILSEQSIKFKQLSLQLAELKVKNQSSWMDYQSAHNKESAFKKKRVVIDNSSYGKNQQPSKSKRKGRADESPNTKRKDCSVNVDNGLNETMIEEVRALIQATISHKNKYPNVELELEKFRKEIQDKKQINTEELQKRLEDFSLTTTKKIEQTEQKINQKLQNQRNNTIRFAQQSSISIEKILSQINNIHIRMCEMTEQNEKTYTNPKNVKRDSNQKSDVKQNNLSNNQTNLYGKTENKVHEMVNSLNRQFIDWKLKVMREMAFFIKSDAFQQLLNKFQSENTEKINKISKNFTKLSKEVQNLKNQTLKGNMKTSDSQMEANSKQKQGRSKNTEKSMAVIQQSLIRLQSHFKQKLKSAKKEITDQLQKRLQRSCSGLQDNFHKQLQVRQRTLCELIETNSKPQQFSFNNSWISQTKISISKISEQMLITRYLHLGDRSCKDFIEWEKNIVNFMEENYVWKVNSQVVLVMAAGLYRLEAGLYPDNDTDRVEAFIVLNGTPISSFKNKQVPGNCLAPARGSVFNEAVLLPAKSKIWIKTQAQFCGQAYLQILKL